MCESDAKCVAGSTGTHSNGTIARWQVAAPCGSSDGEISGRTGLPQPHKPSRDPRVQIEVPGPPRQSPVVRVPEAVPDLALWLGFTPTPQLAKQEMCPGLRHPVSSDSHILDPVQIPDLEQLKADCVGCGGEASALCLPQGETRRPPVDLGPPHPCRSSNRKVCAVQRDCEDVRGGRLVPDRE